MNEYKFMGKSGQGFCHLITLSIRRADLEVRVEKVDMPYTSDAFL